jgi:hypothetical protein
MEQRLTVIVSDGGSVLDQLIIDSGKGAGGIDGEAERKRKGISDRGGQESVEIDVGRGVQTLEDFLLPGGREEVEGFFDARSVAFLDEGTEKVDGHLVIFDGFVFVAAALGNDQFMESERGRVGESDRKILNIRLDHVVYEERQKTKSGGVHP